MAAAGEVGLQNFPKQIPFQQAVGHGQKLLDNLMEILGKVKKPKINHDAFNYNLKLSCNMRGFARPKAVS